MGDEITIESPHQGDGLDDNPGKSSTTWRNHNDPGETQDVWRMDSAQSLIAHSSLAKCEQC